MSSEEEVEGGKKCKRSRQRVDAGEPRNSYSSIPNFSSRPALNSVYGAAFYQHQFGFYPFGHKMLNELLNRRPEDMTLDHTHNQPVADVAQHMLRNILQGKKELYALEQQLRADPDLESNNNDRKITNLTNGEDKPNGLHLDHHQANPDSNGLPEQAFEATEATISDSESVSSPGSVEENSESKKTVELKRVRMETLVSSMRSSPSGPVNGCKKRKLYHPQQHEVEAERPSEDEDENLSPAEIRQKVVEKNALKNQLRSMQEQLAQMQQKYVQLCTKMDQEDAEDTQEEVQDTEPEEISDPTSPQKTAAPTPIPSPPAVPKDSTPPVSTPPAPQPTLGKMLTNKFLPPSAPPMNPHFPMHPNFNGALSFLQHQMFQEQNHIAPHHHHHAHPVLSNAAAMYLNVGQKLLMEQEARIAKEAMVEHPPKDSPRPSHHSPKPSPPKAEIPKPNTQSFDLEGLADALKSEISSTLSNLIDTIIARFLQQKRLVNKTSEATFAAEQLNKDLLMASQLLDRKSPRTKVIDRGNCVEKPNQNYVTPTKNPPMSQNFLNSPENNINAMNLPRSNANLFPPKMNMNNAAALYSSMNSHMNPFCMPDMREGAPEQNEALSLVVAPKKKRHKVTDTRITPRTVSRILAQDRCQPHSLMESPNKFNMMTSSDSPPPRPYPPTSMLPVSLPTSVAIPNPGLHESQVFTPYGPFYGQHQTAHHMPASPPGMDLRDSPPLHHSMFHPALLAAAQQQHMQRSSSPDYINVRSNSGLGDSLDRGSDNSMDGGYDGMPTSSTLSPMHLRKAKLMFFWVRYPSSSTLKTYFPDIKFNKNNTAQLVKWFSNFREFYYIQMEKYARQAISEGVKNAEDLHVSIDCDIYRVLNVHYNRNNSIEAPTNFRYVIEQTLKEFYKAIQNQKDQEQSWKKSIYKVISRLDDPVPEYFKTPNFLEQLSID